MLLAFTERYEKRSGTTCFDSMSGNPAVLGAVKKCVELNPSLERLLSFCLVDVRLFYVKSQRRSLLCDFRLDLCLFRSDEESLDRCFRLRFLEDDSFLRFRRFFSRLRRRSSLLLELDDELECESFS